MYLQRAILLQRINNRAYITKDGGMYPQWVVYLPWRSSVFIFVGFSYPGMTWEDMATILTGSTVKGSEPGFLYPNNVDAAKVPFVFFSIV